MTAINFKIDDNFFNYLKHIGYKINTDFYSLLFELLSTKKCVLGDKYNYIYNYKYLYARDEVLRLDTLKELYEMKYLDDI